MINYTKTIYNQKHKHILKWISINSTNKIKSVHVRHSLFAVIFLKERSVLKAERKNKRRSFHAQSFDYEKLCNFHFSQSQCSSRLRRRSSSICTKIHLFKHKTLTFFYKIPQTLLQLMALVWKATAAVSTWIFYSNFDGI